MVKQFARTAGTEKEWSPATPSLRMSLADGSRLTLGGRRIKDVAGLPLLTAILGSALLGILFLLGGAIELAEDGSFTATFTVSTALIEDEAGELLHYGSDCASRTLRQDYQGKRLPISREAAISMGRSAKRGESFAKLSATA